VIEPRTKETDMHAMNSGFEGEEDRFGAVVKGAVVCLLMAGAVLVGSGMNRQGAIAADAATPEATAPAMDEAWTSGYFPALFPAPQGAPEPHVEQF
jgi:hypothetical protein